MIAKILFFLFLLAAFFGFAQIPNPGFESVSGGMPTGWNQGPTYSLYPLRDTSAAHTGSNAAAIYGSVPPAYNGALAGAFTQSSALPVSLTGWYKFFPEAGDSLIFNIGVWKQGNYSTAATNAPGSSVITGTASVYTQFNIPINYASYAFSSCDSAYVIIYPTGNVSYGGYNWTHPNTIALFDDLAWTFSTTGIEVNKELPLNAETVQPNPAGELAILVYTVGEPVTVSLAITDIAGRKVMDVMRNVPQGTGRYKVPAETARLEPGIYFYELSTAGGYRIQKKFIKQ